MAEEELAPEVGEEIVTDDPVTEETVAPTVEEYARAKGWRPRDDWDDSKGEWRDAGAFLDFTFDRNRDLGRDIKELRGTVESLRESSLRAAREAAERGRAEERAKWEQRHEQAVEEGDKETAREAARHIARHEQPAADPLVSRFVADNSWFESDSEAKAIAVAAADRVAKRGGAVAEQLEAAKATVHKRFPEYAPRQPEPAKVVEVARPSGTARAPSRGNTFNDMPREYQEAARAWKDAGLGTVEGYVRNYYNKEGTVE